MRELILLDKDGALTKTNNKLLKQCAIKLRNYINIASARVRTKFNLNETLLPVVEAVINDTVKLPYKGESPVDAFQLWEGTGFAKDTFPREMVDCYFLFEKLLYGSIGLAEGYYFGGSEDVINRYYFKNRKYVFEHDGQYYVWVDFEQPSTYKGNNIEI